MIASLNLDISFPPVCAISGRPPPPCAPTKGAIFLTKSTADILFLRSSLTPITTDDFPSFMAKRATIRLSLYLSLKSSTIAFNSLA